MKDPPGQGESVEGGSATRWKLSRSADLRASKRGTADNSIEPKGRAGRSGTVAIPLTSESAPAALGDRDSEVEGGMVAAGRGRKGKRAEYRCACCGYGIIVYAQPPSCPMCRELRWESVEWRPFSQLLNFPLADLARTVGPTVSRLARGSGGTRQGTRGGR